MSQPIDLIIFDFDGVIVDSEVLANSALAAYLTRHGKPTTLDDAIHHFMGKRMQDVQVAAAAWLGRELPPDFITDYRDQTREMMRRDVTPIPGVQAFLDAHAHLPRCVASSSMHGWLEHCVAKFELGRHFDGRLTSATEVANGKPAPDVFLLAAKRMGARPERTLVIEDSPAGITGARAAGMRTIGFLGGSHIRPGHADRLSAAGADHLIADYTALKDHFAEMTR